jgi:hypothetical protein
MALLWRTSKRRRLVKWPEPVDERLEILVRLAMTDGEQTNSTQLLAALVATCPTEPEEIALRLKTYRRLDEEGFRAQVDPSGLPELRRTGPRRRNGG